MSQHPHLEAGKWGDGILFDELVAAIAWEIQVALDLQPIDRSK